MASVTVVATMVISGKDASTSNRPKVRFGTIGPIAAAARPDHSTADPMCGSRGNPSQSDPRPIGPQVQSSTTLPDDPDSMAAKPA